MVVLAAKDVVQTKKAAVHWRRSFFVAIGASLVLLSILFGLMLASQELSKETHIRQSHVLTAGNHVVEVAPATQDVPLYYLPFMDAGLLGSIVGKSIMYSLNETKVYEIVTKLSKSVGETETGHEVQIHTPTASLTVNSGGAAIVVAGRKTLLCGAITCTKVSVTMADDLDKIVSDALERQQPRRLGDTVCPTELKTCCLPSPKGRLLQQCRNNKCETSCDYCKTISTDPDFDSEYGQICRDAGCSEFCESCTYIQRHLPAADKCRDAKCPDVGENFMSTTTTA